MHLAFLSVSEALQLVVGQINYSLALNQPVTLQGEFGLSSCFSGCAGSEES